MKEILLNSLKLCIITLIAGLLLGVVYEITKDPRANQEEKAKQKAYKTVFDTADTFEKYEFSAADMEKYLTEKGCNKNVAKIDEVVTAKSSSGEELGYVVTVTDKEGYGGDIQFTVGILKDGTINGISFLIINETAGVGMKATENKFKKQFVGRNVDSFEYTKSTATADNQIDAISGATITTNAVTNGVNAAILSYKFINSKGEVTNE